MSAAAESSSGIFSEEALEEARVLFARPVEFLMGAAAMEQLPASDLAEVAAACAII